MTDDTIPLLDALLKRDGGDFKELADEVLGRLMVYDVEGGVEIIDPTASSPGEGPGTYDTLMLRGISKA